MKLMTQEGKLGARTSSVRATSHYTRYIVSFFTYLLCSCATCVAAGLPLKASHDESDLRRNLE